jgi:site-specific recombinase XerD
LKRLTDFLSAKAYSPRTVRNYVQEIRFIFAYFNDVAPAALTQEHIVQYLNFIKREHGVGRDKCRMVAQSCSFFFKHILPTPYIIPNALYPRKEFRLPDILSVEQMDLLLSKISNIKHKAIIALLYGTGLRLGELRFLKMCDIHRADFTIKVVAGKGNKDRFTILPKSILDLLEGYYRLHRPKVYLFEGQKVGVAMNDRSIQHAIRHAMIEAGFEKYKYSAHSLRHSFATHLLDSGSDIHTIKELLGHSKIETTMIYLHLTRQKREKIVSPLDTLSHAKGQ